MTEQEQDAVIGRLVRERRDLQVKTAEIEDKLQNLGFSREFLGQISSASSPASRLAS